MMFEILRLVRIHDENFIAEHSLTTVIAMRLLLRLYAFTPNII